MYSIELIPHTGKWKVVLPDSRILNDKYPSAAKAAEKLHKYLKGQK